MKLLKAKKPISANHPKLGLLQVGGAEVPQFDSLEEFTQAIKGTQNAIDWVNSQVANGAKNLGRTMLRTADETAANAEKQTQVSKAEDGTETTVNVFPKLYKSVLDAIKSYVPSSDAGSVSVKSKAEQRDAIKARLESGEQITREELLQMLA